VEAILTRKAGTWSLDILEQSTRRVADGGRRGYLGAATSGTWRTRGACTPAGCETHYCREGLRSGLPPTRVLAMGTMGQVTWSAGVCRRRLVWIWHPGPRCWILRRLSGGRSPFDLNDHRLPSSNPAGWAAPLSSAENVQTSVPGPLPSALLQRRRGRPSRRLVAVRPRGGLAGAS